MRRFAALLLTLALVGGLRAQEVVFDSLARRLPAFLEGYNDPFFLTFRFTNKGKTPVEIGDIKPACGCIKVVARPFDPIAPGARDSIVVQYKSDRYPGTIGEPIHVYLEGNNDVPLATLYVNGEVLPAPDSRWSHLPQRMGALRLKRKEVAFGPDDVVMRIPVANTGKSKLCPVPMFIPPFAVLEVEPKQVNPGQEADFVIRLDRSKLPSYRPVKAAIVLEGIPGASLNSRRIVLTIN